LNIDQLKLSAVTRARFDRRVEKWILLGCQLGMQIVNAGDDDEYGAPRRPVVVVRGEV
jgi:hypothetical protein